VCAGRAEKKKGKIENRKTITMTLAERLETGGGCCGGVAKIAD